MCNRQRANSKPKPKARGAKAPRYQAVTEALRRQMTDGRLAGGMKLPPLRDLADRFKVSTNTVRSAIRVLEHEGCLYHVPAVGAFVSPQFPGASRTSQITIALVTLDIGGAFEMSVARGIERACHDRSWGLQIYDSRGHTEFEQRNLDRLSRTGAHGAVIVPTGEPDNIEVLFKLKLAKFPMVLVDRSIFGLKVDVVQSDHERAGYLATEHLLEHGHPGVLMITEPAGASSIDARIRGYQRALADHAIERRPNWIVWVDPEVSACGVETKRRWLAGHDAALPVLKTLDPPLAFFALNDYIGWGLVEACRELNLRVPEDVSIVCVDDSDITRAMSPPMTVVAQRTTEIGQRAVELLEKRLQSGPTADKPRELLIGVDLIERQSVAPQAVPA